MEVHHIQRRLDLETIMVRADEDEHEPCVRYP
jgi:hypothetical protein